MNYRALIESFVYWSGRMAPDRAPKPFNALLMISGGETLLVGAALMIRSSAIGAPMPIGAVLMTFISILIFVLNLVIFKYAEVPEKEDSPHRKTLILAPLFGSICLFVFIFSGIVAYNSYS